MVVSGEAGVGKTAVLDTLFAEARAAGAPSRRLQATEGVSAVPLGALAHLLPAMVPSDERAQLSALTQALDGQILYVDDAPLLDPQSLHVIVTAVRDGRAGLVATARSEHRMPSVLASAVAGGRRVELTRLGESDTGELVQALLGGPVDQVSVVRLHQATDGLPLAITELVLHGLDHGRFRKVSGLFRWTDTDHPDLRLASLIGARVDALHGADRDAVEVMCLAEHLPMEMLRAVVGAPIDLHGLEAGRWLQASERLGWVRPGHPLLQRAVLAQLGSLRRLELIGRLVEVMQGGDDELSRRRVVLACEVDAPVDPAELTAMAAWARSHRQGAKVINLLRRAWRDAPSLVTGRSLADALDSVGEHRASVDVYSAAEVYARTDTERVDLVLARAHVLRHGVGDVPSATDLLDGLRRTLSDPDLRARVAIAEAEDALLLGRCNDVLDLWTDLTSAGERSAELRFRASQSVIAALLYAGRLATAEAAYADFEALAPQYGMQHPLIGLYVEQRRFGALTLAGGGAAIVERVELGYTNAVAGGESMAIGLSALPAGMVRWLAGDLVSAERMAREAMASSLDEVREIASYLLARVLRLQGRHREILELCEGLIADGLPTTTINTTWVISARAMARAALSRRPDIVEPELAVAVGQAADAERLGQLVPAAYLLHDLLSFGMAEQVSPSLDRLAASCDAPAVRLLAAHARAVVARDAGALEAAARDAELLGLGLFAAQMRADRDRLGQRDGAAPLTVREREVARAAGAGMTDKEISQHLGVSVRTVNAHLRSVYTKLALSGRRDLVFLHESGGDL